MSLTDTLIARLRKAYRVEPLNNVLESEQATVERIIREVVEPWEAELERYRKNIRERVYVDATPDEGYVQRILEAHIDESFATDNLLGLPPENPLCVAMNEAQAERNRLLRKALGEHTAFADEQAQQADRENGEKCDDCGQRYLTVYRVPDWMWRIVSAKAPGGLLCPECCDRRLRAAGHSPYWEAAEAEFPTTAERADADALASAGRRLSEWYPWDVEACKEEHRDTCRGCAAMADLRAALAAHDKRVAEREGGKAE